MGGGADRPGRGHACLFRQSLLGKRRNRRRQIDERTDHDVRHNRLRRSWLPACLPLFQKWTDRIRAVGAADARCQQCPALLEAAPYRGQRQPALPFHECGRGGTGRRATLRSLWAKARGSSSLLDRTSTKSRSIRVLINFVLISLKLVAFRKVVWHDFMVNAGFARQSRPGRARSAAAWPGGSGPDGPRSCRN